MKTKRIKLSREAERLLIKMELREEKKKAAEKMKR